MSHQTRCLKSVPMVTLPSLLDQHRDIITKTLRLGKDNWATLLRSCDSDSLTRYGRLNREETWTFLVACGYAIAGAQGVTTLANRLTGRTDLRRPKDPVVWLEYRPMTPRKRESRSRIDLSLGDVTQETGTKGGIELASGAGGESWICFCEMKWESDICRRTSNDENRNQLVRVIESALYFQTKSIYADEVFVNLVTPVVFQKKSGSEKLYGRKFIEYETCKANILMDLDACKLPRRDQFEAVDRLDALSLRWSTFDELFNGLPDSAINNGLKQFWCRYGSYLEG